MPVRTGSCNRCGQCCGAEGSPQQRSPWPSQWPGSLRTWRLEDLFAQWPHAFLFGIVNKEDGTIGPNKDHGSIRILAGDGPRDFHWVWVEGHAICKDISAGHDGTSHSLECPLLLPDPGDSTRPCGLVGTGQEDAFRAVCQPEPPEHKTVDEVARWEARHPLCSYVWVEE